LPPSLPHLSDSVAYISQHADRVSAAVCRVQLMPRIILNAISAVLNVARNLVTSAIRAVSSVIAMTILALDQQCSTRILYDIPQTNLRLVL